MVVGKEASKTEVADMKRSHHTGMSSQELEETMVVNSKDGKIMSMAVRASGGVHWN